jgi:hypothetical protein
MTKKKRQPRVNTYCRGKHTGPWSFVKTDLGTKRTCACGYSVTDTPVVINILPSKSFNGTKRKVKAEEEVPCG